MTLAPLLLAAAAFLSGAMNAVAGGGAFITFPALILAGIPAIEANATSTVALFPGQLASTWAYRSNIGTVAQVNARLLAGISLVGGLIGALLLLFTPSDVFATLVPWLLLFATLVFAIGNFAPPAASHHLRLSSRGVVVAQALISLYGGYFGGGIGFLMLAALTLYGLRDMHAMNGLRLLLASLMNGTAIIAFIVAGAVRWPEAVVMALAAMAGGYAGAHGAKRVNQRLLKAGVVALGCLLTAYFFWRGA